MASAIKDAITISKGYDISLFKDQQKAKEYQCALCHHVCRNAVELSCGDDTNGVSEDGHDVLFCEQCLSDKLRSNGKQCPIKDRHQNVSFNPARNIRKQINNLTVCCRRRKTEGPSSSAIHRGCEWEGKISKLSHHRKTCCFDRPFCRICRVFIDGDTLNEHDQHRLSQHISILHSKLESITISTPSGDPRERTAVSIDGLVFDQEHVLKTLREIEEWKLTVIADAAKNRERLKAMERAFESLQGLHQELRAKAAAQSTEIEELRSIVTTMQSDLRPSLRSRVSVQLKRPNEDHKSNEGMLRYDGHRASYGARGSVASDDEVKTTKFFGSDTEPCSQSEDGVDAHHVGRGPPCPALNCKTASLRSLSSTPGPMNRSGSTRYFHPEGVELYHPKRVKYELFHPQRAVKVRVVNPGGGGMKWRSRWMCCGSAKGESVYLMDILEQKGRRKGSGGGLLSLRKRRRSQPNSTQYVVVRADEPDKLPKKWRKNMHSGCKRKKDGAKGSGYYKCCKGPVGSAGCRKRYKCCKQDVSECLGTHKRTSSGCKIGWGC